MIYKRIFLILPMALALAACGNNGGQNAPATAPTAPTASAPAGTVATPASPTTTPAPGTSTAGTAAAAPAAATTAAVSAASTPADNMLTAADKAAMAKAAKSFVPAPKKWVEGKNYFVISPQQPKVSNTDKIEVTEVFNFGCPACNAAHKTIDKMAAELPSYATMAYLPAGFRPDENWVLYQRTYYTAKALGLAAKTYDAMFTANWKTGETGSYDLSTGRLNPKSKWPDIHTIAKFYSKFGVAPKQFVAVANSFSVNTGIKRADQLVKAYGVPATPTIVIDGKYRFTFVDVGTYQKGIELAKYLVAKEAAARVAAGH